MDRSGALLMFNLRPRVFLIIGLWLLCATGLVAQHTEFWIGNPLANQAKTVQQLVPSDLKLDSKLMGRAMPYRVIVPAGYDDKANSSVRYPVIYLLHGLAGHFDNWTSKTKLSTYLTEYKVIVVMPEGDDGWYTDSATIPNDKYESYILQELIPDIDNRFRTIAERRGRVIAGLSMGGYGSFKFGLKRPELFSVVGSFSGALTAALPAAKDIAPSWKELIDSLASVYGPEDSQTRKDNDIYRLTREIPPEQVKSLPFFYLSCGTEDGLIKANREFTTLLAEKKIPHEFRELPGKHDWEFWDAQIQEFLRVVNKIFNSSEVRSKTAAV
jgi:putative tributyrin esterase